MLIDNADHRKYVATGLLIVLGVFLLYLLRIFFLALFGAYVFSFMFAPVYVWLKRKIGRDEVAALLTVFLILVVALVPLLTVCYVAFNQALTLQDKFDPQDFSVLFERFSPKVRASLDATLERLIQHFFTRVTEAASLGLQCRFEPGVVALCDVLRDVLHLHELPLRRHPVH